MTKHNQDGAVNGLALSLILTTILLVAALGFGFWAFSSRQDYKDNTDAKIDAAVKTAVDQNSITKDKQAVEAAKNPLLTYNGPEALGSIIFQYPKTWSGYIADNGSSGLTLNTYFNPPVVPAVGGPNAVFALQVQVLNQSYASVVQGVNKGAVVSAYSLPKLPKVVGVKVVGPLNGTVSGTMVILPLRSQTIEIQTDTDQYLSDFNNYILPNFSFSP